MPSNVAKPQRHKAKSVYAGRFLSRESLTALTIYLAALLVAKVTFPPIGWSARDAKLYHFPIINFFIENGFWPNYPQLIAMLPGMHAFFAVCARIFHIRDLEWDGTAAFLIQSSWGAIFLLGVLRLYERSRQDRAAQWPMLVPLLCSSIPFYSWLWPTTDLEALTVYVLMILLLENPPKSTALNAFLFAALVLVASLFRQNYAVLSLAFGLFYLVNETRLWRDRPFYVLACSALPLIAGGHAIIACYDLWGGLTPPSERWHGSGHAFHLTTVLHVVAYTGLTCWPLMYQAYRRLDARGLCAGILLIAVSLSIVVTGTVDLSYDKSMGRSGSLVWSLIGPDPVSSVRLAVIAALFTSGFFIWFSIAVLCRRDRLVPASVLLAVVYFLSLIVQVTAWQRYIEPTILISIVACFGFSETYPRWFKAVYVSWFGLYAVATAAMGWSGLSVAATVGSFGLQF